MAFFFRIPTFMDRDGFTITACTGTLLIGFKRSADHVAERVQYMSKTALLDVALALLALALTYPAIGQTGGVFALGSHPHRPVGLEYRIAVVPSEVADLAAKGLEVWRHMASRNPQTYGIEGLARVIPKATLSKGYVEYVLWRDDIERFVTSMDDDPTHYAFNQTFVFPIVSDGQYLGGVRVRRARYRDGTSWPYRTPGLSIGDFSVTGFDVRGVGGGAEVHRLSGLFEDTDVRVVGYVRFRSTSVADHFVFDADGNRVLVSGDGVIGLQRKSGNQQAQKEALFEANQATQIKRALGVWLKSQPHVWGETGR